MSGWCYLRRRFLEEALSKLRLGEARRCATLGILSRPYEEAPNKGKVEKFYPKPQIRRDDLK